MDEVAERAGVSRALVSLVMRGSPRVSEQSRATVLSAADALQYRPNLMARNLASKRTTTIGLILNDLHNPFFPEIADGIYEAAEGRDYRVLINSGFLQPATEQRAVDTFLDLRTDGIILAGPALASRAIERAAKTLPVVAVGRSIRSPLVDTVNNDEAVGAGLVVDHLVKLGHTRLVHIDGGRGAGAAARRTGFVSAMESHGLSADVVPGSFTEASGVAAMDQILRRTSRPTAVFAANDLMAVGALDRIDDAGLVVPDDISLVGYDNIALSSLHHISMTTVDQPRLAMGRLAVDALLERIEQSRTTKVRHVLAPSLEVRATTGPPREHL